MASEAKFWQREEWATNRPKLAKAAREVQRLRVGTSACLLLDHNKIVQSGSKSILVLGLEGIMFEG
jgi:hypothetical protein